MGWLGKLENLLLRRKQENHTLRKQDVKRRKDLMVVEHKCKRCSNNKAFYKNGVYKCTNKVCGTRDVI